MSKRMESRAITVGMCGLLLAGGALAGCKGSDAPQTLTDQKAAVSGAPAPPGAMKAIADAQAAQANQGKQVQDHAKSGQAAAQAAAAADKPK